MSDYVCALTNEPAKTPVVSTKSGHIFEVTAIERHLETESTCPITNQPLTKDDLIPLVVKKPNKKASETNPGISAVVSVFQDEWDSLMLESFTLKQNLEIVRKELSHALYQYDASCRTLARLVHEKDEAKKVLNDLVAKKNQAKREAPSVLPQGAKEFPEKLVRDIYDVRIELSKMRREREKDDKALLSYSSQEMILNYKLTTSVSLHSDKNPGIRCIDVNTDLDDLLMTGGNDGKVVIYNRAQDKIINTLENHIKPVNAVKFIPGRTREGRHVMGISAGEDGVGYAFMHNNESGEITVTYKATNHTGALTDCIVHPVNYLGLYCSRDGSFSCHDLAQGMFLSSVMLDEKVPLRALAVHPDGEIAVFAGEDGSLKVWNLPQLVQIGQIKAHKAAIDSVSFSDDGRFLATSSSGEKMVKLWDIRKMGDDTYRILNDDVQGVVNFDRLGRYLAVGSGPSLLLYNVRTMEQFTKINAHQDMITGIQFGNYSSYVATASLDGRLNIFS